MAYATKITTALPVTPDAVYAMHSGLEPRLRHQAVWRVDRVAFDSAEQRTALGTALDPLIPYPPAYILGHPVIYSSDVNGFCLDGRRSRPHYIPKRRAS